MSELYDPRDSVEHAVNVRGPSITINVGLPPVEMSVNRELICRSSEFFHDMMRSEFIEKGTNSVDMNDDDPKCFELYLRWLQTRRIASLPVRATLRHESTETERIKRKYDLLISCYILGDKIRDTRFRDNTIDAISAEMRPDHGTMYFPGYRQVVRIYENTLPTSRLRSLLIDLYASYADETLFQTHEVEHKEFLFDVLKRMSARRPVLRGGSLDKEDKFDSCQYHDHAKGFMNCYRFGHT